MNVLNLNEKAYQRAFLLLDEIEQALKLSVQAASFVCYQMLKAKNHYGDSYLMSCEIEGLYHYKHHHDISVQTAADRFWQNLSAKFEDNNKTDDVAILQAFEKVKLDERLITKTVALLSTTENDKKYLEGLQHKVAEYDEHKTELVDEVYRYIKNDPRWIAVKCENVGDKTFYSVAKTAMNNAIIEGRAKKVALNMVIIQSLSKQRKAIEGALEYETKRKKEKK